MFVTLEGVEGVGKSAQTRLLKEYLERTNQEAIFIREPGSMIAHLSQLKRFHLPALESRKNKKLPKENSA